jgi:hypothetical protein
MIMNDAHGGSDEDGEDNDDAFMVMMMIINENKGCEWILLGTYLAGNGNSAKIRQKR